MTDYDFTGEISFTSNFEHEISADPYCALDYSETGDPTDVALAARVLASHWHGGQASALYAFSSSGVLDADACIYELGRCDAEESRDALLAFFEAVKSEDTSEGPCIITSVWSCFGHRFMSDDNGPDEGGNTTESCLTCGAMFELAPRADDPTSGDYRASNGDDPTPCARGAYIVHGYANERVCEHDNGRPCAANIETETCEHVAHDCNCRFCA